MERPTDASSSEIEQAAITALEDDAGCTKARAKALVAAISSVAADEALAIVAGDQQPIGSAVDRRVATLNRVIQALPQSEPMPNQFEIGVVFRITPEQGRNVLRTYQARYSKSYAGRLQAVAAKTTPQQKAQRGTPVYVFSFNDPSVLEFAVDRLRRRGLTKSVVVDRTALTVTIDRGERDRFGKDAKDALK